MKDILYFPVLVVKMIGWVFWYVICVWCRCKITGERYYAGGKTTGGFPSGFYKLRNGLRYYKSGTIVKEDYNGRCEMVLSPTALSELVDRLKNVGYRIREHGQDAAKNGIPITDNPWKGMSHEFHIWRNGWIFETHKMNRKNDMIDKCEHEYRVFGTRLNEDVYPYRELNGKPEGYYGGWVVCDKCGDSPWVNRYEVTHTKPSNCSIRPNMLDKIVKIIEYNNV